MKRSNPTITAALALGALLFTVSLCTSSELSDTPDYYWDNQNFGTGLCIVRINSDAWPDVVGSYNEGGTRYLMNDAPNWNWCKFNLQSGSTIEFSANRIVADIIYGVGDHDDVAMAAGNSFRIYENNRDGSLSLEDEYEIPDEGICSWFDLGTINGDAFPDMVLSAEIRLPSYPEQIFVYEDYNDPIPSEPTQDNIIVSPVPPQIQLAHLEGDGTGETIVAAQSQFLELYENSYSSQTGNYYNDTFSMQLSVDENENPVVDFVAGDLDADGDVDLVGCSEYYVQVFVNQGSSGLSFIEGQGFSAENVKQIALGEFNYDGFPDLAVATDTDIKIYRNEGGPFNLSQPVWHYDDLGEDFGGSCEMHELQFCDLLGLGAQSLVFAARGTEGGAIGVFRDTSNPQICPVKNFAVADGVPGSHPQLTWLPSEEQDADHYDIYRALMPDETPPSEEDFELLAVVNHPDTCYIDSTVAIHTQYDNYKIWYAAKAVDMADQESLWSNFVRFWGYYEENGGSLAKVVDVIGESALRLRAAPNPFNHETRLIYTMPVASHAQIQILDIAGRVVAVLQNEWVEAGQHSISFDSQALPSGNYFVRLSVGGSFAVTQLTILK